MRASVVLVGFVVVLSLVAPWTLRRAGWVQRAPRLAIIVWLGLAAAAMISITAAGLAAALELPPVSHGVADLLLACLHWYEVDVPLSSGTLVGAVGAATALTLPGWVLGRLAHLLTSRSRARRRHLDMLALAVQAAHDEVLVLDHPRPALYCVPGRVARVVVTSAATRVLDREELAAAVDHERGHLRGRHHLLTGVADAMAAAVPLPLFRHCRDAVRRLVELAADDHAVRVHARTRLAAAVEAVVTGAAPAYVLGAGEAAAERLIRLANPPGQVPLRGRLAGGLLVAFVFAVPVLTTGWALSHTVAQDLCTSAPGAVQLVERR